MLAVNPLVVYSFNEGAGTAVADASAEGGTNNGTLAGPILPTWQTDGPSPAGGAYLRFAGDNAYNGSGGRVDAAELLSPITGTSTSVAYWIRTSSFGNDTIWQAPAVVGVEAPNPNDGFYGSLTANGRVRAQAGDNGSAYSNGPINDGNWHFVVHTRDATSGQVRTYVDGVLNSTVQGETGVKTSETRAIGAVTLVDAAGTAIQGYNYLGADVDQVQIYDRVLSAQEVAGLMLPAAAAPAAPTVTADTSTLRAIALSFPDVAGALGYSVLRSTTGAPGSFTEVAVLSANPDAAGNTYRELNLTAGQTYYYQVVAFNQGGSSSAASVNAVAPATGNSIAAHYFNSTFWGAGVRPTSTSNITVGMPTVNEVVGGEVNFDYGNGSPNPAIPNDNFSTVFTGKLVAPETGFYTLAAFSDDDSHVFLNGELVASDVLGTDGNPGHGIPGSISEIDFYTQVQLTKDQAYDIVVLQSEGGGGAASILRWLTPSMANAGQFEPSLVPVSALRAQASVPAAPTGVSVSNSGTANYVNFTDNALSEVRYEIERSIDGGPFVLAGVAPIVSNGGGGLPTSTSFTDLVTRPGNYTYRVRAVNFDGTSPATAASTGTVTVPPTPVVEAPGAQGYYFNTQFWGTGVRPADGQIVVGRPAQYTETVADVTEDWGTANGPTGLGAIDNFSTVYTGTLVAPETGTYEILGFSDDDSYVWVNGQLVSADPGGHGVPGNVADINVRNPITLTAGVEYNFVAIQSEGGGGAAMFLRWKTPTGTGYVDVPAGAFSGNIPNAAGALPNGAPVAPTNVRIAEPNRQGTFAFLEWNDVATNEVRYTVERTNVATGAVTRFDVPINSTSFLDTGLSVSTQYSYRVFAGNFQGESAGGPLVITTRAANEPPDAPASLALASRNGVRVTFYDASTTENEFVIERAVVTGGTPGAYEVVGRLPGSAINAQGGILGFTDTTATAGTTYAYRVSASNAAGASAPTAVEQITYTPATGTGLRATYYNTINFSGTPLVLSPVSADVFFGGNGPAGITADPGNANANDTFTGRFDAFLTPEFSEAYTFLLSSDDGIALTIADPETGQVLLDFDNLAARRGISAAGTWQDTAGTVALQAGKRYLLSARFVEDGGDAGYRIGWSSPSTTPEVIPAERLTPPAAVEPLWAPTGVAVVNRIGTESVTIGFNPNVLNLTETGFEVLRATGTPTNFSVIGTTGPDATSFTDNTIAAGQTYYYQVRAVQDGTPGPASATSAALVVTTAVGTGLTFNGTAAVLPGADNDPATAADNQLQITDNVNDRRGSIFLTDARPIDVAGQGPGGTAGFTSSFTFQIPEGSNPMADGFAFVIQRNSPTVLGNGGGGLAYTGSIPNSVAIEFDLYNGAPVNQVGVYANGFDLGNDAIGNSLDTGLTFNNGHRYKVDLGYDATANTLTLTITDLDDAGVGPFSTTFSTARVPDGTDAALDISSLVGGQQAFFGFTGATGGLNADQRIVSWTLNGQAVPFAAVPTGVVIQAGQNVAMDNVRSPSLTIQAGATLTINPNGGAAGTSKVGALTIDPTGALDLKDNDIVISGLTVEQVRALVRSGYNGGAWDGPGIRTSLGTVASGPLAGKRAALAIAKGDDPAIAHLGGSIGGQAFGPDDVVVKYTLEADANLDGDVDLLDVLVWGPNFTGELGGTGSKTWSQGDWDYDGDVDLLDVLKWGPNFTGELGGGGLAAAEAPAPAPAPVVAEAAPAPVTVTSAAPVTVTTTTTTTTAPTAKAATPVASKAKPATAAAGKAAAAKAKAKAAPAAARPASGGLASLFSTSQVKEGGARDLLA